MGSRLLIDQTVSVGTGGNPTGKQNVTGACMFMLVRGTTTRTVQ